MDFGDILAQWEGMERRPKSPEGKNSPERDPRDLNKPRKRLANAPSLFPAEEKKEAVPSPSFPPGGQNPADGGLPRANPMDVWLRRYGVVDKDEALERHRRQERNSSREHLKRLPAEATIDLHGLTRDEAWSRLDCFVGECSRRGLRKIMIVHGKGNHSCGQGEVPVLSAMVRSFVECDSRLGMSGHPDKRLGGTGATWAVIKKNI